MTEVDYIIVGLGLSGLALAEKLKLRNQNIIVFDKPGSSASKVAGGMYNPVILKRFTLAWDAEQHLEESSVFYANLETKLNVSFDKKIEVYRRFNSVEEQNNWFTARDKPGLDIFLNDTITKTINPNIFGDHGYGLVNHTGVIDTMLLLETYKTHLLQSKQLVEEEFEHSEIQIKDDNTIQYKDYKSKAIIFCEGIYVKKNPYFSTIDIRGNKGEYLIIKSQELKLDCAVKSGIFIIPLGDDTYKVGASYDRDDITTLPTPVKREQLTNQLEALISVPYTIIDHITGIRPTTKDRRPYLGSHVDYNTLYIFNGLGSRGIMTSPVMANALVSHILDNEKIPSDIDYRRHL